MSEELVERLAFLAVWRFRVGVGPTVLACALVGLIASVLP